MVRSLSLTTISVSKACQRIFQKHSGLGLRSLSCGNADKKLLHKLVRPGCQRKLAFGVPSANTSSSSSASHQVPVHTGLGLSVGAAMIPDPPKRFRNGEDAYFVSTKASSAGVADGVGGWIYENVDSGYYSRGLLRNMKKYIEQNENLEDSLLDVLTHAHNTTTVLGSCTACVIQMTANGLIETINLGDSGFVYYSLGEGGQYRPKNRSEAQEHSFNFPLQLRYIDDNVDLGNSVISYPYHADVTEFHAKEGDCVVIGTDGLWDNVFPEEITPMMQEVGSRGPRNIAEDIARLAFEKAHDSDSWTPWSSEISFHKGGNIQYTGGKPDDITAVVCQVVKRDDAGWQGQEDGDNYSFDF